MPGNQRLPTRITRINTADARPKTPKELDSTINKVANALEGEWGSGQFDGGIDGIGFYNKRGFFWDFVIKFTGSGVVSVKLPYVITDSVVETITGSPLSNVLSFVVDSDVVSITADGETVVRSYMIPVGK